MSWLRRLFKLISEKLNKLTPLQRFLLHVVAMAIFLVSVAMLADSLSKDASTTKVVPATVVKADAAKAGASSETAKSTKETKASTVVMNTKDVGLLLAALKAPESLEFVMAYAPEAYEKVQVAFKSKNSPEYWLEISGYSWMNIEREVLLKDKIPYQYAAASYFERKVEKEQAPDLVASKAQSSLGSPLFALFKTMAGFIVNNIIGIALLTLAVLMYLSMSKGMGNSKTAEIIRPESIEGDIDDLVGMDDVKQEVLQLVELFENRQLYRQHDVDRPFNIMLSGPAGTGKTKLAGYLAKRLGLPIIFASGASLETGFVGGGAGTITNIHKRACKESRCIIFLDEAQQLFRTRGRGMNRWEDDTSDTLLALLDGIRTEKDKDIIWIVASNFDDSSMEMDPAMLRRFPLKISVRLPNKEEREGILKMYLLRKHSSLVNWDTINLDYLGSITANLSPATLETIIDRASLLAIQEKSPITGDILFRAFERITVGLTDRKTTEGQDKSREIIAIHELGHFFVDLDAIRRVDDSFDYMREHSKTLKISTEAISKVGALGYVLSSQEEVGLYSRTDLESRICSLYGGVAAEELFYGKAGITLGSHNDIEKATSLLNTMINELSMYSASKINYRVLANATQAKGGIPSAGSMPEARISEVEAKSEELYSQSQAIVAKYKEDIEAIKSVLLERYVLSKDEIFELLESRWAPPKEEQTASEEVA